MEIQDIGTCTNIEKYNGTEWEWIDRKNSYNIIFR